MQQPSPFFSILQKICESEQQHLQPLRQLINEQQQFTIGSIFNKIRQTKSRQDWILKEDEVVVQRQQESSVTSLMVLNFLQQEKHHEDSIALEHVESMIKFYSKDMKLRIDQPYFQKIFLSKENKLLAKIVQERKHTKTSLPKFVLGYCRKLIREQCKLHRELIEFRKKHTKMLKNWIQSLSMNGEIQWKDLKKYCCNDDEHLHHQQQCQIYNSEAIHQYLQFQHQKVSTNKIKCLFIQENSYQIKQFFKNYLTEIKKNDHYIKSKTLQRNNPLINRQFHRLHKNTEKTFYNSLRYIQSIEKHMKRIKSKENQKIQIKIKNFQKHSENYITKILISLRLLITLEEKKQNVKIKMSKQIQYNSTYFYNLFLKDHQGNLIPTSFIKLFEEIGVKIKIQDLYAFFKRYGSKSNGKISFKHFDKIFLTFERKQTEVNQLQFHMQADACHQQIEEIFIKSLLKCIKIEDQILKEKKKIIKNYKIKLKDAIEVIDNDQDHWVSETDLKVAFKKYLSHSLKTHDIQAFWHSLGCKNDKTMITNKDFMNYFTESI